MRSALDIFKIGIGPSSSHTFGPMNACKIFLNLLASEDKLDKISEVRVDLYGSLSQTGRGHNTDKAIIMGLAGNWPEEVDVDHMSAFLQKQDQCGRLDLDGSGPSIHFKSADHIIFNPTTLPLHENGMVITAFDERRQELLKKTYYSVGGGFLKEPQDFATPAHRSAACPPEQDEVPYPFGSAKELLAHCEETGMSISTLILHNETAKKNRREVIDYCVKIVKTMMACMERGMMREGGYLPGPDRVPCRAPALRRRLASKASLNQSPIYAMDWVNMCAMAVSEQNALGGKVVTAPTNGSCGVVPAVIAYYDKFVSPLTEEDMWRFILASGSVGLLFSMNASISGAEVGCQGEVGVACSMAAAGLAELFSASPVQVCAAAEIGMEHNLGLTCDAVRGMVQIPCIERNAINAVKAINAAGMAIARPAIPSVVSLDNVIAVMYQTGKDLNNKYRETALGGLASITLDGHPFPTRKC